MADDFITPDRHSSRSTSRQNTSHPETLAGRENTESFSSAYNREPRFTDDSNEPVLTDSLFEESPASGETDGAFYGITTHNPFDSQHPENNDFFPGSEGLEQLEHSIHLCQFGNSIVFINGDPGCGKSFFIARLMDALADSAHCAYVTAGDNQSDEGIALEVAQQLGVNLAPNLGIRDLAYAVQNQQPLEQLNRYVVVVDDIDLLGEGIVANLINSSQLPGSFHLVMAGDSHALDQLDNLQLPVGLVKSIHLQPLNLLETRDYLSFKMQAAGYGSDDYFDTASVKKIHKSSGGYPAMINENAEQWLFTREMESAESEQHRNSFPLLHIGGLTFLLFVLILAFFYSGGESLPNEEEQLQLAINESINNPPSAGPIDNEASPKADPASVANNSQVNKPATDNPATDNPAVNNADPIVTDNKPQALVQGIAQDIKTSGETPVKVEAKPQATVDTAAASEKPVPADTVADAVPVEKIAAPINDAGKTPEKPKTNTYSQDEQVVMAWPDDRLSLQVIGAYDKKGLENYRQQQPNKNDLLLVTVPRDNRPWHILVTGLYASNSEARSAIQQLPQTQINDSPWIRKTANLKQQIALFHSQ